MIIEHLRSLCVLFDDKVRKCLTAAPSPAIYFHPGSHILAVPSA
ncbi:hypothetical protein CPter291_3742 [Collimonas pratensis]|uniref:Uncharacterized protein n=1 Tax=Collimonas pratensis TaxID=279113 RepID=A0ABM5ZA36_9BURK|nr:hypothetical protein CPter291_3742 [Collimonas pratensis]